MKTVKTLTLLTICFASIALAEDFKTTKGKEYKNVTVSRVETDGIVLRGKTGISKVYFIELAKEVQERFRPKPAQAAAVQPKPTQIAQPNTETRQASIGILFVTILAIAILVAGITATVAVVNAKKRREKRALLVEQAKEFIDVKDVQGGGVTGESKPTTGGGSLRAPQAAPNRNKVAPSFGNATL